MSNISEGILLGLGHPLLDIICNVDQRFLDKYGLKANDSIRADDSHQKLYEEITERFDCQYIAGGSVQNTLRAVQWMINQPNRTTFMGAIGDDHFGRIMMTKITEQSVKFVAKVNKEVGTGTSACLITDNGKNRSLIAYLGAAQTIRVDHLRQNCQFVDRAKYFYTSGYHLGIDPKSIMELALNANQENKIFCLNLSAPYVSQKLSKPLLEVYPYVDYLFGNDSEALAFAETMAWKTKDLMTITKLMAETEYKGRCFGRVVVITQGKDNVLVSVTKEQFIRAYPVNPIDPKDIVDTIGAGDAFVGGFFAQLIQNKSLDVCIESGVYCAQEVIKQIGCQFPNKCFKQF